MDDPARPLRLLLVEDSADDAELLTLELRNAGFAPTVRRVDNERQMRAALSDFNPDIVVSDSNLPGFSGEHALQLAREMAPHLPFVCFSGLIEDCTDISGADAIVGKDELRRLPRLIGGLLPTMRS